MSRKQSIYQEAARLFSEKGYASASMRDLAIRVGIEPSSLYSHIKSKDQILKEICFECAHAFNEGLERIEKVDSEPLQKIRALIALHLQIAEEDPSSIVVFNDEWKHLGEESLQEFLTMRKSYEEGFKSILRAGKENGTIRNYSSGLMLNTIVSGLKWMHDIKSNRDDAMKLKNDLTDLLIHGIKCSSNKGKTNSCS